MLTIFNDGQIFGWTDPNIKFVNSIEDLKYSPSPKITLIDSVNKWYSYDRSNSDLTVYWVTEALANERAISKPIIKLHPNDRIFSSSTGPNNKYNLLYWFGYMQGIYRRKYKYLIPKNEIFVNNVCCTLGQGRLPRTYTYQTLLKYNLDNRNVSFATDSFRKELLPDICNELPGQDKIKDALSNFNLTKLYKPLELDWNKTKKLNNWWGQHLPGIQSSAVIPTHAYMDSSLLFINETIVYNPEFFVTEKTIKGLLSGRPFIIIGCYKFLEQLRNLGFITWASILDESYDEKESLKDRIDFAVASTNAFIKGNVLNNQKKLQTIQNITDHNKKIFFETNWWSKIENAKKQILTELGMK